MRFKIQIVGGSVRAATYETFSLPDGIITVVTADEHDLLIQAHDAVVEKNIALTEQLAAREWQPIESAPKPRIYILLYFPARDAVGVGMWSATNRGWWLTSLDGGGIADGELVPTHWMPLPAAPVSQQEKVG